MSDADIPTDVRRIAVDDAQLHVEITGEGPDLYLVAGLGGRGAFWANQVQSLARHFRVIVHDHRGCGASSPDKCVTGAEQMAEDLIAVMDVMGSRTASVVGHSTGGAIGQHVALRWPQRLERLVLSCTWAGPDAYFRQLFAARREILVTCGAAPYLAVGAFLAMPSYWLQPLLKRDDRHIAERTNLFPGMAVELSRIDAVIAHDLRDQLSRIVAPTLCIGASDDQITPPGFTEELSRLISGAELELLERGGHFCPITESERYNERLRAFLRG